MKPPFREDSHRFTGDSGAEEPARENRGTPGVERLDRDGVVYLERGDRQTWEDRQRARSLLDSGGFFVGALTIALGWLSLIMVIVSLVMKFTGHSEPWGRLSVVSLIVLVVSMLMGIGYSLTKHCPLCHGTPLHSRRCPKHRLAQRWPLLTYRATVVLRILTTLSFRCMYCGTPFRLFKKSSRQR